MRGSRSAGDLDSAVRALIGRVAREATPREAREDQAGAGVIVCVHDNPASGELSLVGDGRDEAVLAIRRTCQGSMRAELIATAERLERREGCRGDERQTTSTRVVAIGSFVLDLHGTPADDRPGAPGQASGA